MARHLPNKTRKEIKRKKGEPALIVALTDGSRLNIRSPLGAQLLRLWMYDSKTGILSRESVKVRRDANEALWYSREWNIRIY